jgi:hypothetical protein
VIVLAASSSSSSVFDQPGTLGFLVVFGMAVVLYFLFRSMSRHLRKVNDAARAEADAEQRAATTTETANKGNGVSSGG